MSAELLVPLYQSAEVATKLLLTPTLNPRFLLNCAPAARRQPTPRGRGRPRGAEDDPGAAAALQRRRPRRRRWHHEAVLVHTADAAGRRMGASLSKCTMESLITWPKWIASLLFIILVPII